MKIALKRTRRFGKGVFSLKRIKKNEVVAVFDGPFYDDDFDDWTTDLRNHTIQCGDALWRDSKSLARYFNHSCEPNCGIKGRFKIVAMREIEPGEHLTWDYEMTEKSNWWKLKCKCGSKNCRKLIGNYKNLPRKLREKYKGFISTWLTKK